MKTYEKKLLKDIPVYTTFNDGGDIYSKYKFDKESQKYICSNPYRSILMDGNTLVTVISDPDKEPSMLKYHHCKICGSDGAIYPKTSNCFYCGSNDWNIKTPFPKVIINAYGAAKKEFDLNIEVVVSQETIDLIQKEIDEGTINDYYEASSYILDQEEVEEAINQELRSLFPDHELETEGFILKSEIEFFTFPEESCCRNQKGNYCSICGKKLK